MVTIKNENEIAILRKGTSIMGAIFDECKSFLQEGVTTKDLDAKVEGLCKTFGVRPAFKGYKGFPACICASKNDMVVHGIPDETKLNSGDIVGIDFGIVIDELYLDSAYTFVIGFVPDEIRKLLDITRKSCLAGVDAARPGNTVRDVSRAIEALIKPHGYGIVKDYVGHGIGYALHEDPQIPNYDTGQPGMTLKEGMTVAIEPMVNLGTEEVRVGKDTWAVYTLDHKPSAHFEHTLLITDTGPEVLTRWPVEI